jgi:hypothetical protein
MSISPPSSLTTLILVTILTTVCPKELGGASDTKQDAFFHK